MTVSDLVAKCNTMVRKKNLSNLSLRLLIKKRNYHGTNSGVRCDNHVNNDSETSTDEKMPTSIRNRTPTFIAYTTYNKADANRRWNKMPTSSYLKHLQKKLMTLHTTNAPDAVIVPCITKIRQRDIDRILEMHQCKTQAKKSQSQHSRKRNVLTICPVQQLKIKDKDVKALATLDSS